MSGINQFKPFATGSGANVLTPTAYAALTTLISQGFQSGVAQSQQVNTPLRQSSFVSAAMAQIVANNNVDANDDGNLSAFVTNFLAAVGNQLSFQSSISPSGYVKLPGGLIVQWTICSNVAFADINVVFPIAFPNNVFSVVGTYTNGGGSANVVVGLGSHTLTTQSFGAWYGSTNARIDATVYFIAIGN